HVELINVLLGGERSQACFRVIQFEAKHLDSGRGTFDGGQRFRNTALRTPNPRQAIEGGVLFVGIADLGNECPRSPERLLRLGQPAKIQLDTAQVDKGRGFVGRVAILLGHGQRLPEDPLRPADLALPVVVPTLIDERHRFPSAVFGLALKLERPLKRRLDLLPGMPTERTSLTNSHQGYTQATAILKGFEESRSLGVVIERLRYLVQGGL